MTMALDEAPQTKAHAPLANNASAAAGRAQVTAATTKAPGKTRKIIFGLGAVGALALATYLITHRGLENTDDAQVDADVVAIAPRTAGMVVKVNFIDNDFVKAGQVLAEIDDEPAKARLAQAEGNLAAAIANAAAADADARLSTVGAHTNKSAATASFGAASASASGSRDQVREAEARVAAAEATLAQTTIDRDRAKNLVASGSVSQVELDRANTAFDTATAQLAQARASLANLRASVAQASSRVEEASAKVEQAKEVDVYIAQAEARAKAAHAQVEQLKAVRDLAALDLSYTKITAPSDGVVSKKSVVIGQMLSIGSPIVQLVPTQAVWITANFKETQVGDMRVGQPAEAVVDTFPGITIRGQVESFSAGTGARFALLPPDNATGNFTKVVQRIPVRIKLLDVPQSITLRAGMNVDLTVNTRHH
ncbi:MAG: HlyD family secretion protein [Polyangiaceae bacterium]|nr:HlyD family secretion protein [Polyangiaceae bacterium]